jgi:hypothetical protein
MNFEQAIEEMTKGKKVRRKGWKDVWLIIDNNGNLLCCSPNFYNKEQIDTKIDDLSLTNVENILADDWEIFEEKRKWWEPKKGKPYYFIRHDVNIDYFDYGEYENDKRLMAIGNCFQTAEQAKFMVEKLKVIHELERFAYENNEKEIDWNDVNQTKYYLGMFQSDKIIAVFSTYKWCYTPFNIYFTSEEIAKKAIETIGEDRIKKYYFGVEDE